MSICVFQLIVQQWDKSQNTPEAQASRQQQDNASALSQQTAFYAFDKRCVIDQQGDDVMGDRLRFQRLDAEHVQIDRFKLNLNTKQLSYLDPLNTDTQDIACMKNQYIQVSYQWRQRVFEGGFYYWLYENVTLNAVISSDIDARVFVESKPDITMHFAPE